MNADQQYVVKTIDAAAKLHGLATYTELLDALRNFERLMSRPGWALNSGGISDARTAMDKALRATGTQA